MTRAALILVALLALLTCAPAHAERFTVDGQVRVGPSDVARWYAQGHRDARRHVVKHRRGR